MSVADHEEGFAELLEASGITLTLEGVEVEAVVERSGNEAQGFDVDPGECQQVTVSFFKSAVESLPTIGNYFTDDEGGRYRITARRPNPGRPVAKYICEYSGAEE